MYGVAPSLISTSSSTNKELVQGCPNNICTIGEIRDLSGVDSGAGLPGKIASQMAITAVNNMLSQGGSPVRFKLVIDDGASDPTTSLTALQNLASQGIQVCVCGDTSGEAANMLSYANSNHIVLLAISSAVSLAIPNDYLFRLIPDDAASGPAGAAVMYGQGVRAMIMIYRNDPFGSGLANSTVVAFKALGGTVVGDLSYSPVASGSYDFTAQLTQANSDYQNAVKQFGASHVAIATIGFSEVGTMLSQAQVLFPALLNTTWYGGNGIVGAESAITSPALDEQVKLISTSFAPENSSKFIAFSNALQKATGGSFPQYEAAVYDETWVAAMSILAVGNNGTAVQKILPTIADNTYGVIGWLHLDAAGDLAGGDQGIWEIANVNGQAQWVYLGVYVSATGQITYVRQP
jgi:branched-chain amino acid transport system substrate-binding protein